MSDKTVRVAKFATGSSDASLARALADQATLNRGRMNASDQETRYTPAGLSRTHYDALRADRDDLDSHDWAESRGFSGVHRGQTSVGAMTAAEARRRRVRMSMDDGF